MRYFLLVLGWLWAAPLTIPSLILSWILVACRQLNFCRFSLDALTCEFKTVKGNWLERKLLAQWAGMNLAGAIWYNQAYADSEKTQKHERWHALQCYVLGIFMPALYFLCAAWIWLFQKDKHAYMDNPFERGARRAAGQPVEVDYKAWFGEDRWPWW